MTPVSIRWLDTSTGARVVACLASVVFLQLACTKEDAKGGSPAGAPSAETAAPGKPTPQADKPAAQPDKPESKPLAPGHRYPVGPMLVFVPGKGMAAIRFGATVETIERHMEAPCDELKVMDEAAWASKTQVEGTGGQTSATKKERCLYVRQAVEFFLEDGALVRLKAHRRDRRVNQPPPGKDEYYGSLQGLVPPRIMMGLHRHIVVEEYGEPQKKTAIDPAGPDGLVERHYYDGIIYEYDKIDNGNVVLGGIEVYPSNSAKLQRKLAVPSGPLPAPRPEPRAK